MNTYIRNILVFIGLSSIIVIMAFLLKSDFLDKFLTNDLLIILPTILAINVATSSILLSKISDIEIQIKFKFTKTVKGMRNALKEQIVLIVVTVVLLIVYKSIFLIDLTSNSDYYHLIINILLLSVFIWYLDILRDIGQAMFDIKKTLDGLENKS
jgi:hypothetical protein